MTDPKDLSQSNLKSTPASLLILVLVSLVMELRLFRLIDRYAVNILFGDDWGYLSSFFGHTSFWTLYTEQFGPHREGLGLVINKFVFDATAWNSRAEAFTIGAVMSAAMFGALVLKKKIFGHFSASDVAIPLIFLTWSQFEIFTGSLNLAPQSFPILLTILYCLAWLQAGTGRRYVSVLIVNFLLLYSGYGLFMGALTPVLLLREVLHSPSEPQRTRWPAIAALAFSMAELGAFFVGYRFGYSSACGGPSHRPLAILRYVALMFASFVRAKGTGVVPTIVGAFFLGAGILMLARCAKRLLAEAGDFPKERVFLILLSYSLILACAAAAGRLCFGLPYAQSSRYICYVIPAFLAFYFSLLGVTVRAARNFMLMIFVAVITVPAVWLTKADKGTLIWLSLGKQRWKDCYLKTENIKGCDAAVDFVVYPNPDAINMKQKLEFLKEHHLNLYATKSAE